MSPVEESSHPYHWSPSFPVPGTFFFFFFWLGLFLPFPSTQRGLWLGLLIGIRSDLYRLGIGSVP